MSAANSTLLENAKKEIRSILITSPTEISIRNFRHMYNQMIGCDIPFASQGFSSAEDFLKSIPDVVHVRCIRNEYFLSAVVNDETSHISKLVSRQKTSNKTSGRSRQHWNVNKYEPCQMPPRYSRKQKFLPALLKHEIESLLLQYADGISIHNFPSAFRLQFGKDLNFRNLGFSCLEDCFICIPDLKLKAVDGVLKVYKPSIPKKEPLLPTPIYKPKVDDVPPFTFNTNVNNVRVQTPVNPVLLPTPVPNEQLDPEEHSPNCSPCPSNTDDFECPTVSDKMKQNFKTILQKNPQGIWVAEFPVHYKRLTGVDFDLHELGYYSMIELTNDLPSIFRKDRPSNCKSDWLLFDATATGPPTTISPATPPSKCDTKSDSKSLKNVGDSSKFLEEVIHNIKVLLQGFPNGLYINDFIHQYTLNCDAPLYLSDKGKENLEEFLLLIADRVPLKLDYSNNRVKVCLVRPKNLTTTCVKLPTPGCMDLLIKSKMPSDAVEPGLIYAWQSVPRKFHSGELYFEMMFASIVNPSCFWIQLKENGVSNDLDRLMDSLQHFYNGPMGNDYMMRQDHITPRMICAGIWSGDGAWHRVAITDIAFCSTVVSVSFVDYGTHGKVDVSNLRYLRKEFLKLPAQAIKARMSFLKPANGTTWDPAVKGRLIADYSNKSLMAAMVMSTIHPGVLSICICDVSMDEDVFLGHLLIQEGWAKFSPDSIDCPLQLSPSSSHSSQMDPVIGNSSDRSPLSYQSSFNPSISPPVAPYSCDSVIAAPISVSPKPHNYVPFNDVETSNSPLDYDSDEIFDDDENALEELCAQYASSKRFVQRVILRDSLKFHIVIVNQSAYVSLGDISLLLWQNESCELLYRRSRAKQLSLESITIQEFDYCDVFYQLRCYNVNGIKTIENMTFIQLFPLNNVLSVLNAFGHPSPTIRGEISSVITKFNLRDDLWKVFSKLDIVEVKEDFMQTDSQKFQRMCVFDLKSTLEGIRYKSLKAMRDIAKSTSKDEIERLKQEIQKYERLSRPYEERINEIKSYYS